jgi:leucyl-tRNA synthetase
MIELLGHKRSISQEPWPKFSEALCVDSTAVVAIQVNGKVRGRVALARALVGSDLDAAVHAHPEIQRLLAGKPVKKLIVIHGKIINIVA